jgi:glycogen debranching enzyme
VPIPDALFQALSLNVVRRDGLRTVIAGYPWFLDWGRDTLIALRGLIAAGRRGEALDILRSSAASKRNGTPPTSSTGRPSATATPRSAPLWFAVAAGDLMAALGDRAVLDAPCGSRPLQDVLVLDPLALPRRHPERHPHGPRERAHLQPAPTSPGMDTNYPAATPRQGYPVEIQALWIATCGSSPARSTPRGRAGRAGRKRARPPLRGQGGLAADCLRAAPGTPAHLAAQEDALRPNQLLAVTLGRSPGARPPKVAIIRACESLLAPGAIRSLADRPSVQADLSCGATATLLNNPHNPYQGHYLGD